MKSEYEIAAEEFLNRVGATVRITFKECGPVTDWDDSEDHNTYCVLVKRNGKGWSYDFHDSIFNTIRGIRPSKYDVLACVETYHPGSIDDFVSEFGYEVHSWSDVKRIERAYVAVCKEVENVVRLFGDVMDEFEEVFR